MAISQNELIEAGISKGLLARDEVASLRVEARQRRLRLVEAAASAGRFPVATLYRAVAEVRGLRFVDLNSTPPSEELAARVPHAILRTRLIVPVAKENGSILVATADPDDAMTLDNVQRILGHPLQVALADPESLQQAIEGLAAARAQRHQAAPILSSVEVDAVAASEKILNQAYLRRASDVHLESVENGMRVRFRVDGRLHTFLAGLAPTVAISIISRIKVLAGLDIAEQRAPQDGRITYRPPGNEDIEIDIRVAAIPTRWGERITMRLLDKDVEKLSLTNLGMSEKDLLRFRQVISRPYGLILLTGPTGSGKTTTLYAALREINQPHLNIMTVEDPIEYVIPGISQVHIGGTDKVTFASALRALVRHDPDVLMVGEIRDFETADIAMKSSMTGHLIFSTLHTNSATAAVTRLVDMGCESYLVGSTLVAVIAQRLVRRLCVQCKQPRKATPAEAKLLGVEGKEPEIFEPGDCVRCMGTGYCGRIGLFEGLWVDAEMRRLISRGASDEELQNHASQNLTALRNDGISKVLSGVTSMAELMTTTVAEE